MPSPARAGDSGDIRVPLEMMLGIIVGPDPSEMMIVHSLVTIFEASSVMVRERLYSLGSLA